MFNMPVYHDPFSKQFDEWAQASCSGTWRVVLDVESYVAFSDEADATLYMISWYQPHTYSTGREAGAFYCPYVPPHVDHKKSPE